MAAAQPRITDILIAGGGLAGLLLARELVACGKRVVVADDQAGTPAWTAAVGLLNPLRGRRYTVAWRAREVFATAADVYRDLEELGNARWGFRPVSILRAFSDEGERECGMQRAPVSEAAGFPLRPFDQAPPGVRPWPFGGMAVSGGAVADAAGAVLVLRRQLAARHALIPERCRMEDLEFRNGSVHWGTHHIEATRLVLAGGASDVGHSLLPPGCLQPVKGESLALSANNLDPSTALVGRQHLAPMADGSWCCGGTRTPGRADSLATPEGRAGLERFLDEFLFPPWTSTGHRAGVRAVAPDRHPLIGPVPGHECAWVLNGLGSQGVACAPWCARMLARHLALGEPLPPEVDPGRFARIEPVPVRWNAVEIAHEEAAACLRPGDCAIDLTAGNGGDTQWLATQVGPKGRILAIDVQGAAIAATRRRLEAAGLAERVALCEADHAGVARFAQAHLRGEAAIVMANLGYLPGSSSSVVTQPNSTCAAFSASLLLLRQTGALVAVIYTGHEGGEEELAAVESWVRALDPECWRVRWRRNPAGRAAPRVLVVTPVED